MTRDSDPSRSRVWVAPQNKPLLPSEVQTRRGWVGSKQRNDEYQFGPENRCSAGAEVHLLTFLL